jgi:hypothetical protein
MGQTNNRLREVYDEFRTQLMGRNKLIDSILPAVVFMLVNAFAGLQPALWSALILAGIITGLRLFKRQTLWFALSGFGGVFLAVLLAWWMESAESYFLPNIITNGIIVLIAVGSLVLRKPMVAMASAISHKWPLQWYAHPRVRSAYMEVTLAWTVFLTLRLMIQIFFYQNRFVSALGTFQILTGTPATIVLLVLSYLYGIWRLQRLRGPSVAEFMRDDPPPWEGQRRGF